jgi:squalene-hopene/tetraprenyl-beta-curcumene cyclase
MSVKKAVAFLDAASLNWQESRKCFTCHTNLAYLYVRPTFGSADAPHRQIRAAAEKLVREGWEKPGPRSEADVVATASALAFNDAATTGKLHPLTRKALDRMWKVQRKDGGWDWLKCNWPPLESDDHYGVTLAAIAVGVAPEQYRDTPQAKKGIEGIRRYLTTHPPTMMHHRAMLLWASAHLDGLLTRDEKAAIAKSLFKLQKPDGGWNLAALGKWEREDDRQQDTASSDGYATGLVVYVLRRAGVPAKDERIQKGVAWLKGNQRESGRWFTRSLNRDTYHYISHAGTAFALMALAECGEVPRK